MADCGTTAGVRKHYAAGEKPCAACTAADRAYRQARRELQRDGRPKWLHPGSVATRLLDVIATYQPVALTELPRLLPGTRHDTVTRTVYKLAAAGRITRDPVQGTFRIGTVTATPAGPPDDRDDYTGAGKIRCMICRKPLRDHAIGRCPEADTDDWFRGPARMPRKASR